MGIGQTCMPMQERIGIATVSEVRPNPDISWIAAILGTGLRIARLRGKAWTGEGKPSGEGGAFPRTPSLLKESAFLRGGAPLFFRRQKFPIPGAANQDPENGRYSLLQWLCSSLRLIKRKALLSFMVVLFPQCGEHTAFFSGFPLGWIH